jgi:hypothetical protein
LRESRRKRRKGCAETITVLMGIDAAGKTMGKMAADSRGKRYQSKPIEEMGQHGE